MRPTVIETAVYVNSIGPVDPINMVSSNVIYYDIIFRTVNKTDTVKNLFRSISRPSYSVTSNTHTILQLQKQLWGFYFFRSTPSTSSLLRRGTTADWNSTARWNSSCSTATWWEKSGSLTRFSVTLVNLTPTGSRHRIGFCVSGATEEWCIL